MSKPEHGPEAACFDPGCSGPTCGPVRVPAEPKDPAAILVNPHFGRWLWLAGDPIVATGFADGEQEAYQAAREALAKRKPCEHHTPDPPGYQDRQAWAEEMSKTHTQRRCNGCGLWAIWAPKSTCQASLDRCHV